MGLIKLVIFGFIFLSIVYLAISVFSRSLRREKLEKTWDDEPPEGEDTAARSTYIEEGMVEYEGGIRKKLIVLVYILPTIAVAVILYLTNTQ